MRSPPLLLVLLFTLTFLPYLSHSIPLQPHELTPTHPRTLVLSIAPLRHSHSYLLSSLAARDHTVTVAHPYDDHLRLFRHGVALYDNLILFTSGMDDFSDSVSLEPLVQWVDEGHNLLLVWGQNVSEPVRLLAYELGVVIAEDDDLVVDHFHTEAALDRALGSSDHTYVHSSNAVDAEVMTGGVKATSPILFHGLPHTFSLPPSSLSAHLYIPVLRAEATAVTSGDAAPLLVSAYQTRSSTRVLFCGSAELFSNAFIAAPVHLSGAAQPSGNGAFVDAIVAWTFRERGVLRARDLLHHQVAGADMNPHSYRVSDYTAFSIVIEQFSEAHEWRPFIASDIPLSFTMIDPYIRHPLTPHANGTYTSVFQVPDVYGVYKFVVEYKRAGYSALHVSQQVSITPYRHDQYERFLWVAYPYYTSAFTLMAAFLLFGWVFLYGTGLDEWKHKKVAEVRKVTETHTHTVQHIVSKQQ